MSLPLALSSLPHTRLVVKSPALVQKKIENIRQGGWSKLHIISDFDMTLTKFLYTDGKKGQSTHGVVEGSNMFSPSYHEKAEALFEKYYPLEVSPTLSVEDKTKAMVEWWNSAHELLLKECPKHAQFSEMVKDTRVLFRDGVGALLDNCASHNVPFLVFSAGLGDVINALMEEKGLMRPNIHIISNMLRFEDGIAVGFQGDPIHVLNKNEKAISSDSPFHREIASRDHCILLGDGLGDLGMSQGVEHAEDGLLTIGFLNDRVEERLETYRDAYDIVVLDDGGMDCVEAILSGL